jgi:A/G-specific adenine glycosylase
MKKQNPGFKMTDVCQTPQCSDALPLASPPLARPQVLELCHADFSIDLCAWFAVHGRRYPWRESHDAYGILVSEIMLQQTQIATVLERGFYARWMTQFPDFATLAGADVEVVLRAWEGLGYYRRARNLHKLAQIIMADHGGEMPRDPAAILALPGIGRYTAGAVSSFAYDQAEPLVDGNVARVLARLFDDSTPVDSSAGQRLAWARATALVEAAASPRVLNSALMELGQTVCRTGQPSCMLCPVQPHCRACDPAALPVKSKRTVLTEVTERVLFLRGDKGVLLEQELGPRRTGLWKLPALPEALADLPAVLEKARYSITRYKVTLWVHEAPPGYRPCGAQQFIPECELPSLPMPAPYRRALLAALGG